MFLYQSTLDKLDLKDGKCTDYVVGWKSNQIYTSKLTPLYSVFLNNKSLSGYGMRMQFYIGD